MKSLEGTLLVASPSLHGTPFSHSVILLMRHDEQGAMGVVLNKPATSTEIDGWRQSASSTAGVDLHVNLGGPHTDSVFALQSSPGAAFDIAPGRLAVQPEAPMRCARDAGRPLSCREEPMAASRSVRIIIGHAAWNAGQLETEIERGIWMSSDATPELVFGDDETLWANAVRRIGRKVLTQSLGIRSFPADPTVN